jgi:hypothetical protein
MGPFKISPALHAAVRQRALDEGAATGDPMTLTALFIKMADYYLEQVPLQKGHHRRF